jgi:hypothetical protein
MAYWKEKVLVLTPTPEKHKSQPTGFSGRREATRAPTVASITMVVLPSHQSKVGVFGWERFKKRRRRLRAVGAKTSVHNDRPNVPSRLPPDGGPGSSPYSLHTGGAVLPRTRTAARANVSGLGSVPRRSVLPEEGPGGFVEVV